jgi:coproporphyrinogen III oxidase-like Fe-S oxidoreductase
LSPRESAIERLLMGLRTCEGVEPAALAALDLDPARLDALAQAGLLRISPGCIVATLAGRLVLDRLTLELAEAARAG